VLVIWFFDKCAADGTGGAELVFGACVDVARFGAKVTEAYFAIAAY
jgi:hypothetical protein